MTYSDNEEQNNNDENNNDNVADSDQYYDFTTRITEREIQMFKDQTFNIRHPDGERHEPWPSDCEPTITKLGGTLAIERVYEWTADTNWCRAYEVEVTQFIGFEYEIDFTGTTNHDIQAVYGVEDMKVSLSLQPFERETICMISRDITKAHELYVQGVWKKCDIHQSIIDNAIAIGNNRVKDYYDQCLDNGINENVEWTEMPVIVRENDLKFVDGEFYPDFESLYVDGKESEHKNEEHLMWRTGNDFFVKSHSMIFSDPKDIKQCVQPRFVKQGELDNAWLTSVMSALALRPDLILKLFISQDGDGDPSQTKVDKYYGFHLIQLCFNGIWTTTIVDDFLPCKPYWLPIYTTAPDNDQLWPALIEKCYAKFLGSCYENLDGGKVSSAFADLTGAPTEDFYINECDRQELWDMLVKMYSNVDTLACSICDADRDRNSEASGLLPEHAYSILRFEADLQLICLRDPFGKSEWNGDWSPNNERWDDASHVAKCYVNRHDREEEFDPLNKDGIIWMSFQDFCTFFSMITVCYCNQKFSEARQVIDLMFDHESKQLTVPVLELTVPPKSTVEWVGLSQHDIVAGQRNKNINKSQLDVCLFVMKAVSVSVSIMRDEPFGFIPMQTKRQQFVQFGVESQSDENDSKQDSNNNNNNATSINNSQRTNANCFRNSETLGEGKYWLIPWTSANGLLADAAENGVTDGIESRYVNLTIHGQCASKQGFTIKPIDGYSGNQIDSVLERFCFKYGEKKTMGDLERRRLQMGQMEIYSGRNVSNRELKFSMTANMLDNTTSVNGYHYYEQGRAKVWTLGAKKTAIFGVQIPIDPTQEFSAAYKYGMK